MKKPQLLLPAMFITISGMAFSSCTSAVNTAIQTYRLATTGYHVYYTHKLWESLKTAEPIFAGYDCVRVQALVLPAKTDKIQEVRGAFVDNFKHIILKDLESAKLDGIEVCTDADCSCKGKILTVQFREEGYRDDILHKITVGGKLRGELLYIDGETGRVIRKDNLELAKNYEQLLWEIHLSVGTKAIKTYEVLHPNSGKELEEIVTNFNKIDPIKPEYKELFEKAR